VRAVALFLLTAGFAAGACAATFTWDGRTYIPLGLQAQSQSVLRFPERLSGYVVEDPAAVHVLTIDERTLSFSPRNAAVDARVILRGESGALYIARASTNLRFYPLLEIERSAGTGDDEAPQRHGSPAAPLTPVSVMMSLMQGRPPAGFRVSPSARSILQTGEFRLSSEQVWSSPFVTGIVASVQRTAAAGVRVEIDPDRIEIVIPELGQLRVIAADRYVLDDRNPNTAAYLVFIKD